MFDFFRKKDKSKQTDEKGKQTQNKLQQEYDDRSLVEITRILTNGDTQMVEDMTLLAKDSMAFIEKYKVWCDTVLIDTTNRQSVILDTTAYWLTGYAVEGCEPPSRYGAYIDWKEETDEILWNLEEPIRNLGYPLSLSEISFTNQESTHEALQMMNDYCVTKGYVLVSLDTDSDCYHLFLAKTEDFDKLVALGNEIKFRFFNQYQ